MKTRTRHGFTITELLIVIVIVGVLAAILFSLAGKMKTNAEKAACVGNMRNVGNAMVSYSAENNGFLPGPLQTGQGAYYTGSNFQLITYLAPYLVAEVPEKGRGQASVIPGFGCPSLTKRAYSKGFDPVLYWNLTPTALHAQTRVPGIPIPYGDPSKPWDGSRRTWRIDELEPRSAGRAVLLVEHSKIPFGGSWANLGSELPPHDNGKTSMALCLDWSVKPYDPFRKKLK